MNVIEYEGREKILKAKKLFEELTPILKPFGKVLGVEVSDEEVIIHFEMDV
jgi:hypothetical protein